MLQDCPEEQYERCNGEHEPGQDGTAARQGRNERKLLVFYSRELIT